MKFLIECIDPVFEEAPDQPGNQQAKYQYQYDPKK